MKCWIWAEFSGFKKFGVFLLKVHPVSSCGLEFCSWITVKCSMMYLEMGVLTSGKFGEAP